MLVFLEEASCRSDAGLAHTLCLSSVSHKTEKRPTKGGIVNATCVDTVFVSDTTLKVDVVVVVDVVGGEDCMFKVDDTVEVVVAVDNEVAVEVLVAVDNEVVVAVDDDEAVEVVVAVDNEEAVEVLVAVDNEVLVAVDDEEVVEDSDAIVWLLVVEKDVDACVLEVVDVDTAPMRTTSCDAYVTSDAPTCAPAAAVYTFKAYSVPCSSGVSIATVRCTAVFNPRLSATVPCPYTRSSDARTANKATPSR